MPDCLCGILVFVMFRCSMVRQAWNFVLPDNSPAGLVHALPSFRGTQSSLFVHGVGQSRSSRECHVSTAWGKAYPL